MNTNFLKDISSSIVVFFIALPLCIGISIATGAPIYSGIISGIVGGLVTGYFSHSQLSVSGPAAGLTFIVASAISNFQAFNIFLVAVVLAGFLQIIFAFFKAGIIGTFFPNAVVKGAISAIGIILILKQIPHALGYDNDIEGSENLIEQNGHNIFTDFFLMSDNITFGCIFISLTTGLIMIFWDEKFLKKSKLLLIPKALLAIIVGTILSYLLLNYDNPFQLDNKHLINLPIINSINEFRSNFNFPNFRLGLFNFRVWETAFIISIVASLESLISIEATDKLDAKKRVTPLNREMYAQGIGNICSGLLGGLPITSVIVRSSTNILAGAQTKLSTILHSLLLLTSVLYFPHVLNFIPLSAIAIILIYIGYKLATPTIFKDMYSKGFDSFIPFVITITTILISNLFLGIVVGIFSSMIFVFYANLKHSIIVTTHDNNVMIRFIKDVTFFNKSFLQIQLDAIAESANVIIDIRKPILIDDDIVDLINDFKKNCSIKNINIEIWQDSHKNFNQTKIQQ